MKKVILVIAIVAAVILSTVGMVACSEKNDSINDIKSYDITDTEVFVGDTMSTNNIKITATMEDDTTISVNNNLQFVGNDDESLKLDDEGKFTKAGEYIVKVYALREGDDDYFIGDWKIKVKVKK
ncbi:MAG: hypothetical protein WCR54_03940 [Clostridia bacterium]